MTEQQIDRLDESVTLLTDAKHRREISVNVVWRADGVEVIGREIEIRHRVHAGQSHLMVLDEQGALRLAGALLNALNRLQPISSS